MSDDRNPFSASREYDMWINDDLADTDGDICMMEYSGPIGYHIHVATGETHPKYLWKVAFFQAVSETLLDMVWVDDPDPADAREQLEHGLSVCVDPVMREEISVLFEDNLRELIAAQERNATEDRRDG